MRRVRDGRVPETRCDPFAGAPRPGPGPPPECWLCTLRQAAAREGSLQVRSAPPPRRSCRRRGRSIWKNNPFSVKEPGQLLHHGGLAGRPEGFPKIARRSALGMDTEQRSGAGDRKCHLPSLDRLLQSRAELVSKALEMLESGM